jgi:hypothetical protein
MQLFRELVCNELMNAMNYVTATFHVKTAEITEATIHHSLSKQLKMSRKTTVKKFLRLFEYYI